MPSPRTRILPPCFCPYCGVTLFETSSGKLVSEIKFNVFDFYCWANKNKKYFKSHKPKKESEIKKYKKLLAKSPRDALLDEILRSDPLSHIYSLTFFDYYSESALSYFIKELYKERNSYIENVYVILSSRPKRVRCDRIKILVEPEEDFYVALSPSYTWLDKFANYFYTELIENGIKTLRRISIDRFFELIENSVFRFLPGYSDRVWWVVDNLIHRSQRRNLSATLLRSLFLNTSYLCSNTYKYKCNSPPRSTATERFCTNCGKRLSIINETPLTRLSIDFYELFKKELSKNFEKFDLDRFKVDMNIKFTNYIRGKLPNVFSKFAVGIIDGWTFVDDVVAYVVYLNYKAKPILSGNVENLFNPNPKYIAGVYKYTDPFLKIIAKARDFVNTDHYTNPSAYEKLTYHDFWKLVEQIGLSEASAETQ